MTGNRWGRDVIVAHSSVTEARLLDLIKYREITSAYFRAGAATSSVIRLDYRMFYPYRATAWWQLHESAFAVAWIDGAHDGVTLQRLRPDAEDAFYRILRNLRAKLPLDNNPDNFRNGKQ